MNWPTSQDYNEAVQDPEMSFTDPALKGGEVVTNAMGLPVPRSGNFADVYQFKGADGKQWALKCFTRKVPGLRERYAKIDEHLRKARLPFAVGFQFFEKGVQVRGQWFPLLKMEWVEGFTLNDFVAENLGKPHYLHALIQMWAKLTGRLRDANMAHADLQHGNVLLVPGATPQKLGLKLIDYDGMWVPALAEFHSGEVGHPNFQHPLRLKEKLYTGDVDRFPHLVIAAGLRAALVGGKPLWDKFDNGDNLFFKEADFRNPAAAPVFKALWELNDPVLRTLVGHIALSAGQPLRKTPWLDDVLLQEGGPRLSADDERQVCELLGVTAAAPASVRTATTAAVEQEFNVFQFLDEDEGPAERSATLSKVRKRPPPAKKKSSAPLLIGAGAVVALLVAGAVAAYAVFGKKDRPTETVQVPPDDGPKPPTGSGPVAPGKDPIDPGPALADPPDRAAAFAGRGYLELQKSRGLVNLNGDFTAEVWVRWPAGNQQHLTVLGDEAWPTMGTALKVPRACGWVLRISPPQPGDRRQIDFTVGVDPGEWLSVVSPPVRAPGGEWHHLAVSKAGKTVRVFLNGTPVAEKGTEGLTFVPCPTDLYVGVRKDAWHDRRFEGEVKGFRLSGRGRYIGPFQPPDKFVKDAGTDVVLDFPRGDERSIPDLSGKGHHALLHEVRLIELPKAGSPVAPGSTPVIGVAALPGGRDFAFARKDDPILYLTTNGAPRPAREAGRGASPLTTLAAAPDGSRAVSGGADGEVRFWTFPGLRANLGRRLLGYDQIEQFQGRYGIDSYDRGVVFRDNASGKEELAPAGKPGPEPGVTFAKSLGNNEKLARDLGPALADEVKLFDGALTAQVFAGGVMCHTTAPSRSFWAWHGRRRPGPEAAANPAVEVTSKVGKEHTGPVVACAVSFDGTRAVTVGRDRQLCEWDIAAAKLVRKFEVPEARAVAYVSGAKTVLLGTETGSAGVWDLDTKARTLDVEASTVPVRAVCVSRRGDLAYTGAENGKVQIWSVPDFKPVHTIATEQQPISALAVSADGQLLAATSSDGWVRYFNAKTGGPLGGGGGKMPIHAVTFLPGGHKIATAWGLEPTTADGPTVPKVAVKDPLLPAPDGAAVLALVQEADVPPAPPQRMGYRPDGKYLWLARQDSMTVADGATGRAVKTWTADGPIHDAAFGPGSALYLILSGGRFQAWDWEKGERLHDHDPAAQPGPRSFRAWPLPTPNRLLVATNTPDLVVWDTMRWKEAERLTPYPTEAVTRAAPYPGGGRFAAVIVGREGPRAVVWDVREKRELFRLEGVEPRTLIHLDVSPGGKWVVGLSREKDDGRVIVWDGKTGMHAHTLPGVRPSAVGGGFSPGGDYYVHCEPAGRRWAVHLPAGKLTDESRGQRTSFLAADAPAANLLATADTDRKVRLWRFEIDTKPADPATTPDPGSTIPPTALVKEGFIKDSPELSGTVLVAGLSGDGKKVYALTQTGTVHVLDAATGAEVVKYEVTKAKPLHMAVVHKFIHPTNGVAVPDRVHVLDAERHLHTVDAEKGTKVRDVNLEKYLPALSATARVVVTPLESHVMIFDPDQNKAYSWASGRWAAASIPTGLNRPPFNAGTRAIAFSTDGAVGAAYAGGKVLVWRTRGGKDLRTFESIGGSRWLAVAGEAGALAASEGANLRAWKFDTGAEVMNVRNAHGFGGDYFAAASAAGLVTAGSDRSLKVWDLKTGKEATRYPLEQLPAGVAVSADGRTAAVWYESASKIGLWALPAPKGK